MTQYMQKDSHYYRHVLWAAAFGLLAIAPCAYVKDRETGKRGLSCTAIAVKSVARRLPPREGWRRFGDACRRAKVRLPVNVRVGMMKSLR